MLPALEGMADFDLIAVEMADVGMAHELYPDEQRKMRQEVLQTSVLADRRSMWKERLDQLPQYSKQAGWDAVFVVEAKGIRLSRKRQADTNN